ncbi:MAG: IMP dehydrogenase [Sulfolobales archaeon]
MFRKKIEEAAKALQFHDVYLMPSLSYKEPREVDLSTNFSKNIRLKIPIASSPMDTVTEDKMSIAVALLGGIGVVHRNNSVEEQIEIIERVKRAPPIRTRDLYVNAEEPCHRVLEIMEKEEIRDLPVIDNGKLIGTVFYGDLINSCREGFEPLIKIVRSPKHVTIFNLNEANKILIEERYDTLAITDQEGFYLGTVVYRDLFTSLEPSLDSEGRLMVAAAISPFDRERILKLDKYADALVSDLAHFHNINAIKALKHVSKEVSKDLVIGNIATYEAVRDITEYIDKIDGLRVGLGGGSICVTPEQTGAYVPTLYAVAEVRDAIEDLGLKAPVIADGGIRSGADIVKALAVGASVAMLGFLLAGTDEASAPLVRLGNKLYKPYRGMASKSSMEKRFARDRYARISKRVEEGIEGLVEYKGSVYKVISELIEAVKAGLGYAGASNIRELWEKSRLLITTERGERGIKTDL